MASCIGGRNRRKAGNKYTTNKFHQYKILSVPTQFILCYLILSITIAEILLT